MSLNPEKQARLNGVWSATPTPFTDDLEIDRDAVRRLVDHHVRLGINGLFLCGTCGEGPWMTNEQRRLLIETVAEHAGNRLVLAAQVTDNSTARILENARMAADAGADIAVIAPPYFLLNGTDANIEHLYREAIRQSPLPVGIYDRGTNGAVIVPNVVLQSVYLEPNVVLVKDSSCDPERRDIALDCRKRRPEVRLLNGNEFDCVSYIQAGYDGLLLGGGIFNGRLARMIIDAVTSGDLAKAQALQERMDELMWDVYGGKAITCWLTGLKHLLVRMGVFGATANHLRYPLTDECRAAIDAALQRERSVLLP